jgi:hypothetical protein
LLNNAKIGNLWTNILNSRINHAATLQAIDMCLDRQNSMDSTLFKCQTFRMNTVQRNLQSLDKTAYYNGSLLENDYCMRCNKNITEDHEHIWECDDTVKNQEDIYERALELFHDAVEKSSSVCRREAANRTVCALGISPETTLSNPLTSGIVTRRATRVGLELGKDLPGFKMIWLPYLSAALTRAFWEIIWNPRTAQVQRIREQMEAIAEEEERQFERRRDEKKKEIKNRKGALKKVLQAEIRKDKLEFEARQSARVKEKQLLRADAQSKKPKNRKRGSMNSKRPNPKKRKPNTTEEEEIPIITRLRPRAEKKQVFKPTLKIAKTRKRKITTSPAYTPTPKKPKTTHSAEDDETPIIIRKRKSTAPPAHKPTTKRQKSTLPPAKVQLSPPPVKRNRQSSRIKNQKTKSPYPTDVP